MTEDDKTEVEGLLSRLAEAAGDAEEAGYDDIINALIAAYEEYDKYDNSGARPTTDATQQTAYDEALATLIEKAIPYAQNKKAIDTYVGATGVRHDTLLALVNVLKGATTGKPAEYIAAVNGKTSAGLKTYSNLTKAQQDLEKVSGQPIETLWLALQNADSSTVQAAVAYNAKVDLIEEALTANKEAMAMIKAVVDAWAIATQSSTAKPDEITAAQKNAVAAYKAIKALDPVAQQDLKDKIDALMSTGVDTYDEVVWYKNEADTQGKKWKTDVLDQGVTTWLGAEKTNANVTLKLKDNVDALLEGDPTAGYTLTIPLAKYKAAIDRAKGNVSDYIVVATGALDLQTDVTTTTQFSIGASDTDMPPKVVVPMTFSGKNSGGTQTITLTIQPATGAQSLAQDVALVEKFLDNTKDGKLLNQPIAIECNGTWTDFISKIKTAVGDAATGFTATTLKWGSTQQADAKGFEVSTAEDFTYAKGHYSNVSVTISITLTNNDGGELTGENILKQTIARTFTVDLTVTA